MIVRRRRRAGAGSSRGLDLAGQAGEPSSWASCTNRRSSSSFEGVVVQSCLLRRRRPRRRGSTALVTPLAHEPDGGAHDLDSWPGRTWWSSPWACQWGQRTRAQTCRARAKFQVLHERYRRVTCSRSSRPRRTADAGLRQHATAAGAVGAGSAAHGDATYLVYEGRRYTYADAHRIVGSVGAELARLGVAWATAAIAMRNSPEWPLGLQDRGSGRWRSPSTPGGRDRAGLRLDRLGGAGARRRRAPRAPQPHLDDTAVEHVFTEVEQIVAGTLPAADVDPDDDATIMYTSGPPAARRVRSARTATLRLPHERDLPHGGLRGAAATADPGDRRRRRPRCSPSRCSTSAGCTRSSCPTPAPAAKSC